MIREWDYGISVGGRSSRNVNRLTWHTREDVELAAPSIKARAIATATALAGAYLHSTYIMFCHVRDLQDDNGVPVARGLGTRTIDLPTRGTRLTPVGAAPDPVPLPNYIAVECARNSVVGRPGLFKLRGSLTQEDVVPGADRQFVIANGSTANTDIEDALAAFVDAMGEQLVIPNKKQLPARDVDTLAVRGVVDNDPNRSRKSAEAAEKEGLARRVEQLVRRAKEIAPDGAAYSLLVASSKTVVDEIKAELARILLAAGAEFGQFLLRKIPEWLRA